MSFFSDNRIVLVCNSLAVHAGVERRTFELACFLRDQGHEVEIVALRTLGKVAALYREEDIPVHHIAVYEYTDRITLSFWKLLRLSLFFLQRRYGVIVGVQPPSHYFCRLAALPLFGRRLFAMERFTLEGRSTKFRRMDRTLQRWTRRIVCVGKLMRDQLISDCGVLPDKAVVVYNGIVISEAPVNESLRQRFSGGFIYGFVGLLEERKRPRSVLEAFVRIARDFPEIRLIVVGDGEQREELEALTRSAGVDEKVFFTGEQKNPHEYYPLFEALIFPSVLEGLPSVTIEAMLHGLPVVCADVRPMNDYVRHDENGLLAAPDDIDSLERQMRRLLENPALCRRLGEAGRAYARQNFDRETQLRKLENIFWPPSEVRREN